MNNASAILSRHWPLGAVCAVALVLSAHAQANSYTIIDLGRHQEPVAVNAAGVVAGNKDPQFRGSFYRAGRWRNLPPHSRTWAINSGGDIVGYLRTQVPILWHQHEELLVLPLPGGATQGDARGINGRRDVVGTFYDPQARNYHCFLWNEQSGSQDLGLMGNFDSCAALDINSAGQITGQISARSKSHAFIFENGKFTDLGAPLGADRSAGYAINWHGVVVGTLDFVGGTPTAYSWKAGLLDPDGLYARSMATSINNDGEVVGWAEDTHRLHAVRFADGKVIRLEEEVVNLEDWKLFRAASINASGVIVGVGRRSSGSHAFMLVPQAPASAPKDTPVQGGD